MTKYYLTSVHTMSLCCENTFTGKNSIISFTKRLREILGDKMTASKFAI